MKIQNIYDNQEFFSEYKAMRDTKINANELIEIPIMKEMLPELKNKDVLDLGCGAGEMSKYFANQGAKSVFGVDISKNMLELASKNNPFDNVSFKCLAMEQISTINKKFDIVFSSLAFHYIEDFDKLMKDIADLLNDGGILLFSQEHPVATAPIIDEELGKYIQKGENRHYLVNNYNNNGKRLMRWNIDGVVKYHRNFSAIIKAILNAEMQLIDIQESWASQEAIALVEKYKYQNDRPYYAFFKAQK